MVFAAVVGGEGGAEGGLPGLEDDGDGEFDGGIVGLPLEAVFAGFDDGRVVALEFEGGGGEGVEAVALGRGDVDAEVGGAGCDGLCGEVARFEGAGSWGCEHLDVGEGQGGDDAGGWVEGADEVVGGIGDVEDAAGEGEAGWFGESGLAGGAIVPAAF